MQWFAEIYLLTFKSFSTDLTFVTEAMKDSIDPSPQSCRLRGRARPSF